MTDDTNDTADDTQEIGWQLVLSAPGSTHVGTLTQFSPTAPDGIVYQSPDMPKSEPWERFVDDDGLFRVLLKPLSAQYVYGDATEMKTKLNDNATAGVLRETYDLKFWSE